MKVAYSIGTYLNGQGIGYTAEMGINGLRDAGVLSQTYSLNNITLDIADNVTQSVVFDSLASLALDDCDAFLGWASMCYTQLLKAHKIGAKTFIPGTSTHPLNQQRIMMKEYRKFGIQGDSTNPILMARMLQEFKDVDCILASSKIVADTFREQGLGDKLELVEHGVDTDKFKHVPIEHDEFHVVFVGGNWIRKGVYYLLKAWHTLKLKGAKLTISSNAPVFQGVDYSHITSGFVSDIASLYNSADLFVFPTLEEGKALAVGEAMACGLPVVITPESGWEIRADREGLMVPPKSIKQLKNAIQYFYDNRGEAKRMGKAARKYAEEHTWTMYQKDLVREMEERI
jgi:glycosyltransferase involved in cell wall biosynthesis